MKILGERAERAARKNLKGGVRRKGGGVSLSTCARDLRGKEVSKGRWRNLWGDRDR